MTSVEFVEKALIGSLLNDSTRRDELPWLRAEDFTNPLCRAIWRHLESGNPPQCQPLIDLVEMSQVLGRDYELHPRLRSPAELATLQFQAPEKPTVVEYGRILVEATIRREVAAMGLRLESLATGEPEQIIDRVAGALALIEGLDQRWQFSLGNREQVDSDLTEPTSSLGADGLPWATDPRRETVAAAADDMDQQMAEKAVIGAAVHNWPPGARAQVLGTVRDCDFTDTRAAATWRAVEHLAEHDAPIDEVTVAWQVLRDWSRFGDGLASLELRETRGAALFHEAGAATLARSTITRVTSHAKLATARGAKDLGVDLATVIDSAATHHVAVAAAAQRLAGRPRADESLTALKIRLLDLHGHAAAPLVTTEPRRQHPPSYHVNSRPLHISS